MYFDTYGPFEVIRVNGTISGRQAQFWEKVRSNSKEYLDEDTALERAIGCYAFSLSNGDSVRPWYIGMTSAKTGFRGELFQTHKLNKYNDIIDGNRGIPKIFLFPLLTPNGRLSRDRTISKPLIRWVEKMLFGLAVARNPDCHNARDTRYLRNVVVTGVFGRQPVGRAETSAVAARAMFRSD